MSNHLQIRCIISSNEIFRNGQSDIGRFILPESFPEGTRQSRARGLFEHDIIHRTSLSMAERYLRVRDDKYEEFRRAEKVDEGMALKI